jgi:hypothetical protein
VSEFAAQRELAYWLLASELSDMSEPGALFDAAERVCGKLSRRMARLITADGYSAILARALHLAMAEFPFLDGVRASGATNACLEGLRELAHTVDAPKIREAVVAVLAGTIALLGTFIGEDLALRLVRDIWPGAPFGGMDPGVLEAET